MSDRGIKSNWYVINLKNGWHNTCDGLYDIYDDCEKMLEGQKYFLRNLIFFGRKIKLIIEVGYVICVLGNEIKVW